MSNPTTTTPISSDYVELLDDVARYVKDNHKAFETAGKHLDSSYSESICRARLEKAQADTLDGMPPEHPIRAAYEDQYKGTSLAPRARCEAAIHDYLEKGKCNDYRLDMTTDDAAIILLLTTIAHDKYFHTHVAACEFQQLPWIWNEKSGNHFFHGRKNMRTLILHAVWMLLVPIAFKRVRKPKEVSLQAKRLPITASIVESRYKVTKKTIERHVKSGDLFDHRTKPHAANAPLEVDEAEVAARWPKK